MLYVEDRLAAHLHLQNSVCVLFTVLEVWRDRGIQKDNKKLDSERSYRSVSQSS